jgi:hypothetical protein
MMEGPDKTVGMISRLHEGKSHHRRLGKIETAFSISSKVLPHQIILFTFRYSSPVKLLPGKVDVPINYLMRLINSLPIERCS